MDAKMLTKKYISIESVYNFITQMNEQNQFKCFYPHFLLIGDDVKLELMQNGFKVYNGEWLNGEKGLIIEW